MKRFAGKTLAVTGIIAALQAFPRDVSDFCDGWEFSRDKETWRAVDIPHDWAIEGPFDPEGDANTAKLPWKGVGWYRKTLVVGSVDRSRRVFLDFEGVMCDGTVYVNEQPCARQEYGYLGMRADVTPYLFEGTNSVLVKADTTKLFSRWYPGAGMYRRVRKIETPDIYLDERDLYVSPKAPAAGGSRRWNVEISGEVTGMRLRDAFVSVKAEIVSPDGALVAEGDIVTHVPVCGKAPFEMTLQVENPRLWEMKPGAALYDVKVSLASVDGTCEDSLSLKTGFRSFSFDPEKGFFLNGSRVQLNGACLHSDLGILGMAFNRSAARRRILALMDTGVNALRLSHNPPSVEVLELCDELGLFVWDECFDKWNATCARGDEPLEEFVSEKLEEFIRRDRNHPCVFIWSIGNEISPGKACPPGQEHWAGSPALGTSAERCARFSNIVRRLDPTRPVGMASCFPEAVEKGDYLPLDITGWNYGGCYRHMRRRYRGKSVLYTETSTAVSAYGHYAERLPSVKTDYDLDTISCDSYDRNSSAWGDIPDHEFARMESDRFVAGQFVWTGTDYLGEPTPFIKEKIGDKTLTRAQLARSGYYGFFDLLHLPKDRAYLYRSQWRKDARTLHIVPGHWTFPGRKGRKMPVYVYTEADEAELFLNGVSLGRRRKNPKAQSKKDYYGILPRYRLIWEDVEYAPGEIKAVSYGADGEVLAETVVRTAGKPWSVRLRSESAVLPADAKEFVFVEVSLADADGVRVPGDNRMISFATEGACEIVSVGNPDPRAHRSFKDVSAHPLFNGRAGLFIRRTGAGAAALKASAPGLEDAEVIFR